MLDVAASALAVAPPEAVKPTVEEVPARQAGRPQGSYVEPETFWKAWEMAVNGASARRIADATDKGGLKFVNRDKAGVIVKAVKADRAVAQRALDGQETPEGFSATADGIRLPMPKRA